MPFRLKDFYQEKEGGIEIPPVCASRFAKEIAGDFNPIHDPDGKRFCVPGDLLFSLVLDQCSLSQNMEFVFSGMVGAGVVLRFPKSPDDNFSITDANGKAYLEVSRSGGVCKDPAVILAMIQNYVSFSGHNFPDLLVPLMAQHKVMINPDRPLVIYERMSFHFDHLDFSAPKLELSSTALDVKGKRGDAYFRFRILSNGSQVGTGLKKLVLSGLRDYDADLVQSMTSTYLAKRDAYVGSE